jgi:hypothetical protein
VWICGGDKKQGKGENYKKNIFFLRNYYKKNIKMERCGETVKKDGKFFSSSMGLSRGIKVDMIIL